MNIYDLDPVIMATNILSLVHPFDLKLRTVCKYFHDVIHSPQLEIHSFSNFMYFATKKVRFIDVPLQFHGLIRTMKIDTIYAGTRLANLTNLKEIEIEKRMTDSLIPSVCNFCTKLEKLIIKNSENFERNFYPEHLIKLKKLKEISFNDKVNIKTIMDTITPLTQLKSLILSRAAENLVEEASYYPEICSSLSLDWVSDVNSGMALLTHLTGLKTLNISSCHLMSPGINHLGHFSNLECLQIEEYGPIQECDLLYLSKMTKLQELSIWNGCSSITTSTYQELASRLTNLHTFVCPCEQINEEGIAYLAQLTSLVFLNAGSEQFDTPI